MIIFFEISHFQEIFDAIIFASSEHLCWHVDMVLFRELYSFKLISLAILMKWVILFSFVVVLDKFCKYDIYLWPV